jgi:hypothetical protein
MFKRKDWQFRKYRPELVCQDNFDYNSEVLFEITLPFNREIDEKVVFFIDDDKAKVFVSYFSKAFKSERIEYFELSEFKNRNFPTWLPQIKAWEIIYFSICDFLIEKGLINADANTNV